MIGPGGDAAVFESFSPGERAQLRMLPKGLAERVAAEVSASRALRDDHPQAAYEHAVAARKLAGRLPMVREATGLAAYSTGQHAIAIAELRAARRLSGSVPHLAVLAECERRQGRPERALQVIEEASGERLSPAARAEVAIVAARARVDLGQPDAALRVLQTEAQRSDVPARSAARLHQARADAVRSTTYPAGG